MGSSLASICRRILLASVFVVAWARPAGAATITNLGPLDPAGINATGQVVGNAYGGPGCAMCAFLYSGGITTLLGTLNGVNGYSYAFGINASRQVVGSSYATTADNSYDAFLYSSGVMTDLGDG